MNRTNPILLRLGYNKKWTHHFNVINYSPTIPVLLKSSNYLYNWVNSCRLSKKKSLFFPLDVSTFINGSQVSLYFKYFFVNRFFFIQKKLIKTKSKRWWPKFFLSHLFWKFENFFWTRFRISLSIFNFNLYRLAFSNSFFSVLFKLKKTIVWKKINIDNLVILFLYGLHYKNPLVISIAIAKEFKKRKNHSLTLKIILHVLSSFFNFLLSLKGILIQISGRWNNKDRTQTKIFFFGKRPKIQTLDTKLNYDYKNVTTPIGVFGIKVWIY